MKITEQDWNRLPESLRQELANRESWGVFKTAEWEDGIGLDTVDLLQIIIYLANRVERLENQGKQV